MGVAELHPIWLQCDTLSCTVLSTFQNFTLHSSVHHLRASHHSVVNENSVAAEQEKCGSPAFNRNKSHPSKTVHCKLWLWQTCRTSHQCPATKGRKKNEGRVFQYQPVDVGMWHGMLFFSPVIFLSEMKKPCFARGNWSIYAMSWLIKGPVQWDFFWVFLIDKVGSWLGTKIPLYLTKESSEVNLHGKHCLKLRIPHTTSHTQTQT